MYLGIYIHLHEILVNDLFEFIFSFVFTQLLGHQLLSPLSVCRRHIL